MRKYIQYILVALLMASCAQVQPLSGGEKDKTAPIVLVDKTIPANGSVGFASKQIEMKFDEYIVLKKPSENVIITPAIEGKPKYKVLNKKLTIDLEDVILEPNTTYLFNFNGAIVDYHEGNDSLYQYVFSTGDYVDSMSIEGKIEDAFTNKPSGKVAVLLYEKYQDSSVFNDRAKYFTKTDASGAYKFSFLGPGQYKVVAVKDENNDLLFNPRTEEQVAILDEWIVLDDVNASIERPMRMFENEELVNEIKEISYEFPGKLTIENYTAFESSDVVRSSWNDLVFDSILSNESQKVFWNSVYGERKVKFETMVNGIVDTLTRTMDDDSKFSTAIETNINPAFNPFDSIKIDLNVMSKSYDLSKFQLLKDTTAVTGFYQEGNAIIFNGPFDPAEDYTLILGEGAAMSIHDSLSKADTILFATRRAEYFGALKMKLTTSKSGFVELLNDGGEVVFAGPKQTTYTINNLAPGNYSVRFVLDENKNQKWDTGNILKQIQPEKILYMEDPIVIRSNWDVEIDWIHE